MTSNVFAFAQPREESQFALNPMAFSELNNDVDQVAFAGIVGQSSSLRKVFRLVDMVAATNATVLLLGETGTGKELIARAIHECSLRQNQPFVTFDCTAIPSSLFESEVFGHERGAFTGAHMRRMGRLELADRGTLFLDEVGDLPLELQPKLLRLLQERTYERVGSSRTCNVDVRLVAATNRNLEDMMAGNQFRSDLYYRLNVFPIRVPPLRERREDIPLLVRHFTKKYARQIRKRVNSVPEPTLHKLMSWNWPGNIRELQNVIERCVILSEGEVLRLEPGMLVSKSEKAEMVEIKGGEPRGVKAQIEAVLHETRGRVYGTEGAAARLGVPASTLEYRIRSLKINKHQFR